MNAKLKAFADRFRERPLPRDLTGQIRAALGVDVAVNCLGVALANPFIVASGQETMGQVQVKGICEAGWGGFVLKTFIGEDGAGHASLAASRKKAVSQKIVFEGDDTEHRRPVVLWDGAGDVRAWASYKPFAEYCFAEGRAARSLAIGSLKAGFPAPGETWKEQEWLLTAQRLLDIGCRAIEIDFSQPAGASSRAADAKQALEWHEHAPALVRRVTDRCPDRVLVISKLTRMEAGLEHEMEVCRRTIRGGASGVVIANRFFRPEAKVACGGPDLRKHNLNLIRQVVKAGITTNIVAAGGIYCGRDVFEYQQAGACAAELLSLITGAREARARPNEPQFAGLLRSLGKDTGRFGIHDAVLFKLLLDPEDGYVAALLDR